MTDHDIDDVVASADQRQKAALRVQRAQLMAIWKIERQDMLNKIQRLQNEQGRLIELCHACTWLGMR